MPGTTTAPDQSFLYHRLSRVYDGLFAPLFGARSKRVIGELDIAPNTEVLEVGVGTGATLDAYPKHARVTGVDISSEMLRVAQEKVERRGWDHVRLLQMDALNLTLPSDSFDWVTAFHILTVVPDHARLMQELVRVCRPGGRIVLVNHLRSDRRWVGPLLDAVNPLTVRLGWHTKLRYEDVVAAAPIRVIKRYKTSPRSLYTAVIAEKMSSDK
jgi:phosphatidylethanolamine/phosphatidyl-N-methylethanolamine N-methyltransferase